MTITRKTVTEDEFLKLKKSEPFSTYRQDAKSLNFSLLFGASYMRYSESSLETTWTQERIDTFIEAKGLQEDLIDMAKLWADRGVDPKLYSYYTVAQYMRTQFFETYPGLMKRILRNFEKGKDQGYTRSYHGGIRRTPLLTMAFNDEGKMRKHENLLANSSIQTDESVTINTLMSSWDDPRALIIGMVHDSDVLYVERASAPKVIPKLKKHFEAVDPDWQGDLLWPTDCEVYDFTNPKHYYKHGEEAEDFLKGK
jgi:DNA polymerase I-like protein with 3'-5' exonuclease and polymerase domains